MTNPQEPTQAEQYRYLRRQEEEEAKQLSADRRARTAMEQRAGMRKRPAQDAHQQQTQPEPPASHEQQLAQDYLEQRRQEAKERQEALRATEHSSRDLDNQGLGH